MAAAERERERERESAYTFVRLPRELGGVSFKCMHQLDHYKYYWTKLIAHITDPCQNTNTEDDLGDRKTSK